MNYEKINAIEKYYELKFGKKISQISSNMKDAEFIIDLDSKIQNEEIRLNEETIIVHPKRKISIFDKQCKHCGKSVINKNDISTYYKHNYSCYECHVRHEE